VSRTVFKCGSCNRRVRSAPFVSLQDRRICKITRYHGNVAGCLEAATGEPRRRGPDEIVLGFYHTRGCGDSAGKIFCRGGCFAVNESRAEEGAA
jgi:hypothetical protein